MSTIFDPRSVGETLRAVSPPPAPVFSMLLLLAVSVVSACVNIGPGTPPRAQTYVLEATVPPARLESSGLAIGIGPVTIPGYLDRNEMVSREAANQLRLDTRHAWGAPLDQEVQRVLAEDLSRLLASDRVVV